MDQWAILGAMDGGSDGSVSKWRCDGYQNQWIREQLKVLHHGEILGAIDQVASYGSGFKLPIYDAVIVVSIDAPIPVIDTVIPVKHR